MTTKDLLQETYASLSGNKVRSALTMLGIVIGISSVIALVAIGQGAQGSVQSSIQSIGANLIIVSPGVQRTPGVQVSVGRGTARSLTPADVSSISSSVANVTAVAPQISGRYQVTSTAGTNTNVSVVGTTSAYPAVRNVQIDEGSFISDDDNTNAAKVAVIGPTVVTDLFGTDGSIDPIGQVVRIKGIQFTIVGTTVAKGGNGFGSQDDMVFVPLSSAVQFLAGVNNDYMTEIDIQASDSSTMTQVQNDVTSLLLANHNISDPTQADFNTLNQADIVATASSVASTFTVLLAAVAGISLIVGGIGIMNMMLTTVTERTREIGLRKAIGAKKSDISKQFLVEAISLTFIGGLVGVILGCSVSFGVAYFGLLQASVSLSSILLAFGVSAVIGIVFGYYPARRAASLNPIDALRYE